jgi:hypothetical protein
MYDVRDIAIIDDCILELKRTQKACLDHRWGKPEECDTTTEEVPSECELELEKEARADYNLPSVSASFAASSDVAFCALISYKHTKGPSPAQLFVIFNDGSYFCSCGFPARIGLPCRHFYCAWAGRSLKTRPGLHCGVQCHPRWFKHPLDGGPKDIFKVSAAIYPYADELEVSAPSLKTSIDSHQNRWRSAFLKGIDGLCLGMPEDGQPSPQTVPDSDETNVTGLRYILDTVSKVKQYKFNLPRTRVMLDDTASSVNSLIDRGLSLSLGDHAVKNPAVIVAKGRPRRTVTQGPRAKKRKTGTRERCKWTKEEVNALYNALEGQDKPDFFAASQAVGSKDENQCRNRVNNDNKLGKWPSQASQNTVMSDDESGVSDDESGDNS